MPSLPRGVTGRERRPQGVRTASASGCGQSPGGTVGNAQVLPTELGNLVMTRRLRLSKVIAGAATLVALGVGVVPAIAHLMLTISAFLCSTRLIRKPEKPLTGRWQESDSQA